jgi:hypothetical protein
VNVLSAGLQAPPPAVFDAQPGATKRPARRNDAEAEC